MLELKNNYILMNIVISLYYYNLLQTTHDRIVYNILCTNKLSYQIKVIVLLDAKTKRL